MAAVDKEDVRIVVAKFGFVQVGYFVRDGDEVRLEAGRTVIKWGTTKGLEELVDGPTPNTKLSAPATQKIPWFGVVKTIPVKAAAWRKVLDAAR